MPADPLLSSELKSLQTLQEELSQRERLPPPPPPPPGEHSDAEAAAAKPADDKEQDLGADLRDFVNEVGKFFEEAEKNIAAHPTASVVGALVVGILIGRMLGRR